MRVVIDTNILLVALPRTSDDHLIFLELLRGKYSLCVTTDILNEYAEIFQKKANPEVGQFALDLLDILPNMVHARKHYFWNLITADPDDNKFVDCAVASGADFIVTDDRHFNELKGKFPPVRVIGKAEFLDILREKEQAA